MNVLNKKIPIALAMALTLTAGLVLSACTDRNAETGPETSSKQETDGNLDTLAMEAVNEAQVKYKASEQAGYAWAKAGTMLASAQEALESGDFETAIHQARQATALADTSLAQAEAEQSAWLERFPKAPTGASP